MEKRLRQVFLPDRGKDLYCHRVLVDRCGMFDISRDRPAVARTDLRCLGTDPERDMPRYEIPCLLVGVGMGWKIRSIVQPELGHERVLPKDEGLLPDAGERFPVPGVGMIGKHGKPIMACAGRTDKEYRSASRVPNPTLYTGFWIDGLKLHSAVRKSFPEVLRQTSSFRRVAPCEWTQCIPCPV